MKLYKYTEKGVVQDLIKRIRYERIRHGWTQGELAERAGVPLQAVKNLETKAGGSFLQFYSIAAVLGHADGIAELFQIDPKTISEKKRGLAKKRVRKRKPKSVTASDTGRIGRVKVSRKIAK